MRLIARSKYGFLQIIQICLLFLVSLNYENLYFYLIFLTFFVCIIAKFKRFRVDSIAIGLALLSICYILFYSPTRDSLTTIIKQFAYPMCYLIGLNLYDAHGDTNNEENYPDNQIKLSIIVVAFGTLLHYLLNASINITSLLRNTVDYWTGEVVSATDQALLPVMAISIFCIWLFGDHKLWKKLFAVIGLLLILAYNFILAGRTIVLLTVLTMCVAFLFIQKYMRSNARMKNYLIVCIIIICVILLFLNNAWGIRDWIIGSNLSQRFESQKFVEDIRFERKIEYISRMLEFPFGGGHLKAVVGGYAHELYLDVLSDVGIIGYLLVTAVVIASLVNAIKTIRTEGFSAETKCMILCVFMGILVVFFIEPILQGEPWFFCIFCFLSGGLKYNLLLKKQMKIGGVKV